MGLQNLPSEILLMILSVLDSPVDLHAAISASGLFLRVFSLASERTLSTVLKNAIHPEALRYALAILHAPDIYSLSFTDAQMPMQRFLRRYFNGPVFEFPRGRDQLIALSHLYCRVSSFVMDYSDRASQALVKFKPLWPNFAISVKTQADSEKDSLAKDTLALEPLSCVETARFQRAFFRFELYSKIFPAQKNRGLYECEQSIFPASFQAREFIEKLEPWEVEEMVCVQEYFVCRLAEISDKIEDEIMREILCTPGVKKPSDWAILSSPGLKRNSPSLYVVANPDRIDYVAEKYATSIDIQAWEQSVEFAKFTNSNSETIDDEHDLERSKYVSIEQFLTPFSDYDRYFVPFTRLINISSQGSRLLYRLLISETEDYKNTILGTSFYNREFFNRALDFAADTTIAEPEAECWSDQPAYSNRAWRDHNPHPACNTYLKTYKGCRPRRARAWVFWDWWRIRDHGIEPKLLEACKMAHSDEMLLFDRSMFRSAEARLSKVLLRKCEIQRILRKYRMSEAQWEVFQSDGPLHSKSLNEEF